MFYHERKSVFPTDYNKHENFEIQHVAADLIFHSKRQVVQSPPVNAAAIAVQL
jgi:hypothetical protein